jgi:DHA2 family methylenomycin A resistance protein-like MFS transporter
MGLFAVCLGAFIAILDTTIVNVALPRIGTSFGSGTSGLEWVVNAYVLAFASLLLSSGALGDRLGQRRVFLAGVALFGSASPLCSISTGLPLLVVARMLQGAGAALLVPGSLSLVTQTFPGATEQPRAVGIWSAAGVLGALVGPVMGGLLVDHLGWRSVFWVNVPIALVCIALTVRFVDDPPGARGRSFDVPGQLLAIGSLAALTVAVIDGPHWGWSSRRLLFVVAVGIVLLVTFLRVERRQPEPMLPLDLFRHPGVAGANAVGTLISLASYATAFVFSLWFQQERHYRPSVAGFCLLPMSALAAIVCIVAGRLAARVGPRVLMAGGTALGALASLLFTQTHLHTPYALIGAGLACFGAGIAGSTVPMSTVAVGSVGKDQAGIASGTVNTARQLGAVLGVAMAGALYGSRHAVRSPFLVCALVLGVAHVLTWRLIPSRLSHPERVATGTAAAVEPGIL